MNVDIIQLSQVAAIVLMFVASLHVVVRLSQWTKRRMERPAPQIDDDRLQHLEEAVDTIALEVERISEAQRFTAKLLGERQGPGLGGAIRQAEIRQITPV